RGQTIVIITHTPWVIAEYAERVVLLADGRLRYDGAPRQFFADDELLAAAAFRPPDVTRLGRLLGCTPLSVAELVSWVPRRAPSRPLPRRGHPLPPHHARRGGGLRARSPRPAVHRRLHADARLPPRAGLLRRRARRRAGAALPRARARPRRDRGPAPPLRPHPRPRPDRRAPPRRPHGDGARAARLQLGAPAYDVPAGA